MKARYMLRSEIPLAADWLCRWRGRAGDPVFRRAEMVFFPPDWTVCIADDDDAPVAAGGIFIPLSGEIGFLGKVVASPDLQPMARASAVVSLVREMKRKLAENGITVAMSMYDEPELSRLFVEDGGISSTPAQMSFAYIGGKRNGT